VDVPNIDTVHHTIFGVTTNNIQKSIKISGRCVDLAVENTSFQDLVVAPRLEFYHCQQILSVIFLEPLPHSFISRKHLSNDQTKTVCQFFLPVKMCSVENSGDPDNPISHEGFSLSIQHLSALYVMIIVTQNAERMRPGSGEGIK
jgi:hypothetical protein